MVSQFNLESAEHKIAADAWSSLNGKNDGTQALLQDLGSLTVDQRISVARSLSGMGIGFPLLSEFRDQTAAAGSRWLRISSDQGAAVGTAAEPNIQFEIGSEREDKAAYKTIFINNLRDPKVFPTEQVADTIKQLSTTAINGDQAAINELVKQVQSLTPAELRVVDSELHHNGSFVAPYFFPQFDASSLNPEQAASNLFSSVANIRSANDQLYFWKQNKLLVVGRNGSETVTADELKRSADDIVLTASRVFSPKSAHEKAEALDELTNAIQDGYRKSSFKMDLVLRTVSYESNENKALQRNAAQYKVGPDYGPSARLARDGKSVQFTLVRGQDPDSHLIVSDAFDVRLAPDNSSEQRHKM